MTVLMQTVGDALVTELALVSLSSPWQARGAAALTVARAYLHDFGETQDSTFRATVTPGTKASASLTRAKNTRTMEFRLQLSRRVTDADSTTEIDGYMKTVEALFEFFDDSARVSGLGVDTRHAGVTFEGGGVGEVYEGGRLTEESMFVAELTVTVTVQEVPGL